MIKDVKLPLIDANKAKSICNNLTGYPTENRVLIAVLANPEITKGGIILPGQNKEDLPRKGVIVQVGEVTEDNITYRGLKVGDVVTYGMYAGKEIDPPFKDDFEEDLTDLKFYVLSLTEIIYIELNRN